MNKSIVITIRIICGIMVLFFTFMIIDCFLSTEKSIFRSKLPRSYKTESGISYRGSEAENKNKEICEYIKLNASKTELEELIGILNRYNGEKNEAKLTSIDYYDLEATGDIHIEATLGSNSYAKLTSTLNDEIFKNPKYDINISSYNEDGYIDKLSIVKKINGVNNRKFSFKTYDNQYTYFEDINVLKIGDIKIYNLTSLIISIIIVVGAIVVAISVGEDDTKIKTTKKYNKEAERDLDLNTNLSFEIKVDDEEDGDK